MSSIFESKRAKNSPTTQMRNDNNTLPQLDSSLTSLILLGKILGGHGTNGEVKISSYTQNPKDIANYGPLLDHHCNIIGALIISKIKATKSKTKPYHKASHIIAKFEGHHAPKTRTQSDAMRGQNLYIQRSMLATTEHQDGDGIFYVDLIGCTVIDLKHQPWGNIIAIDNFGAGDVIEIETLDQRKTMIPWADDFIINIDLQLKQITVSCGGLAYY